MGTYKDPEGGRACMHQAGPGRVRSQVQDQIHRLQANQLMGAGNQYTQHTGPDAGMDTPR